MPVLLAQFQQLNNAERVALVETEARLLVALQTEFESKQKVLTQLQQEMANDAKYGGQRRTKIDEDFHAALRASLAALQATAARYAVDYTPIFTDAGVVAGIADGHVEAAGVNTAANLQAQAAALHGQRVRFEEIVSKPIPVALADLAPNTKTGIVYNVKALTTAPLAGTLGNTDTYQLYDTSQDIPDNLEAIYKGREYTVNKSNVSYKTALDLAASTATAEEKSNELEMVIEMVRQYIAQGKTNFPIGGTNDRIKEMIRLVVLAFKPDAAITPAAPDPTVGFNFVDNRGTLSFDRAPVPGDRELQVAAVRKYLVDVKKYVVEVEGPGTIDAEKATAKTWQETRIIESLAEVERLLAGPPYTTVAIAGEERDSLIALRDRLAAHIHRVVTTAPGAAFGRIPANNVGWTTYNGAKSYANLQLVAPLGLPVLANPNLDAAAVTTAVGRLNTTVNARNALGPAAPDPAQPETHQSPRLR